MSPGQTILHKTPTPPVTVVYKKPATELGLLGTISPHSRPQAIMLAEPALAPLAQLRFCRANPDDCRTEPVGLRGGPAVELTWREVDRINRTVNRAILPRPDDATAATEVWRLAPIAGDCSDYAVTKRHLLVAAGWHPKAVLLAEVQLRSGVHHLIVVLRTMQGDFVLDNLTDRIRPWFEAPYQWVRIQSPGNPLFWNVVAEHEPVKRLAQVAPSNVR